MTNCERCHSLVDEFPEEQLAHIVTMLEAMKNLIAETKDETNGRFHRKPGIAQGKFVCPDDIDADNEMIANMFEQN